MYTTITPTPTASALSGEAERAPIESPSPAVHAVVSASVPTSAERAKFKPRRQCSSAPKPAAKAASKGSSVTNLASTYLMREAISRHRQSNGRNCLGLHVLSRAVSSIRGNQRQSEAIRGSRKQSEAIRGSRKQSEAITGNQRQSGRQSRTQSPRKLRARVHAPQWVVHAPGGRCSSSSPSSPY